jgi:adenylate kinase
VYLILLGAPGTGKGTQAKILSERKGWIHISTGDMLRDEVEKGTQFGVEANNYMERGELVPDILIIAMLKERIRHPDAATGFVLDGFPRNLAQAKALDDALYGIGKTIDLTLNIEVPDEQLVRRLSGRWICRVCGDIYHEDTHPPRLPGRCDREGGELYQRLDDRPETVRSRLEKQKPAENLLNHYRAKGKLVNIDGTRSVEEVTRSLMDAVKSGVPA